MAKGSADRLSLTAKAAKEKGLSYGKYVALYGCVSLPEDERLRRCKHCGKSFLLSRKTRVYCSYNCFEAARSKRYRERRKEKNAEQNHHHGPPDP